MTGGLHIVDVSQPKNPRFVKCFADDGYTHDAQCVIYGGPDTRYQHKEICFNYNEDTFTIVDTEQGTNVSRVAYTGASYTHQVKIYSGDNIFHSVVTPWSSFELTCTCIFTYI